MNWDARQASQFFFEGGGSHLRQSFGGQGTVEEATFAIGFGGQGRAECESGVRERGARVRPALLKTSVDGGRVGKKCPPGKGDESSMAGFFMIC
jgi:hypothetical protein